MGKQLIIFIKNFFILIVIMYISITVKNVLQFALGTSFNYSEVAKPYRLINLNKQPNFELKKNMIELVFLYDYILFALAAYLWIFLILYIIVTVKGNKLWIQISYTMIIYFIIVTYFDPFHYNIFFILITMLLGFINYFLFKKWIKYK